MPKYFGQKECGLIDQYNQTQDQRLFTDEIYPVLLKMVKGIFRPIRYRTMSDVDHDEIVQIVVTRLAALLPRLDPSRGNYYSYLTMVAQNELRKLNRTFTKRVDKTVDIEITTHSERLEWMVNSPDIETTNSDHDHSGSEHDGSAYEELKQSMKVMIDRIKNPIDQYILKAAIEVFDGMEVQKIRGLRTLYSLVQWKTGIANKRIIRAIENIRAIKKTHYSRENIYKIT